MGVPSVTRSEKLSLEVPIFYGSVASPCRRIQRNTNLSELRMSSINESRDIATTSVVAAAKDQVSSDLAGETILLSMQTAMYYGLDEVGSRIWELVRAPIRVSEVRDAIAREYDVDVERCEGDVLGFLRELAAKGLIEVSDGT